MQGCSHQGVYSCSGWERHILRRSGKNAAPEPKELHRCPNCRGTIARGLLATDIDSAGFEVYQLKCPHCGHAQTGVIDPYDQSLC